MALFETLLYTKPTYKIRKWLNNCMVFKEENKRKNLYVVFVCRQKRKKSSRKIMKHNQGKIILSFDHIKEYA